MAPDKIFIDEDLIAFHVLQTKHDGDIEFIRKDALLEWFEALKAQSWGLRENGYGDVFYGAQIAILEEIIDKIKSM